MAAVVGEPRVRERGESLERLRVVGDDGLPGEVAARHHQDLRAGSISREPEQQVVQRRVRQHQPEVTTARCDLVGSHRRPGVATAGEHDRVGETGEQRRVGLRQRDDPLRGLEVAHHQCERLGPSLLPLAQSRHGVGVGRVTRQVVAADALHGQDASVREHSSSVGQAVGPMHRVGRRLHEAQDRAAVRTADRLGVEAPVARVVVLAAAARAEAEPGHGRRRAVVGETGDDREARPAVRAGDERVPEASVGGVGQVGQAVRTDGHVR